MTTARATIRDVAQHAGVSPTTVSHVLSGQGRVNAQTRERVHATVRVLGYRANPLARNLRHERFGAIGLYLPERSLALPFYIDLAVAASRAAFASGASLTLLPPVDAPGDVLTLPLDGVIVAEPIVDDPVVTALAESHVPLVLCERAESPAGIQAAMIDTEHNRAVAQLLDHLHDQGARQIVVVGAHDNVWWGRLIRAAVETWSRRRKRGVEWVSTPFACSAVEARRTVDQVLERGVPDALVIGQQSLAGAALAATTAHGLTVPDDLLLACGVDGPDLPTLQPAVTALDLRPADCGRIAADLLLGARRGDTVRVRPRLVVRESTLRPH